MLKARRHKGQSQKMVEAIKEKYAKCSKPEGIRGSLSVGHIAAVENRRVCSKPEGIRGSLRSRRDRRPCIRKRAQSPKA